MKTYELRPTSDPNLSRVVDRRGEWDTYAHRIAQHCPTCEVMKHATVECPCGCHGSTRYLRGVTAILHRAWGKPQLMTWAKHQLPGVVEQKLRYGGEKGDAVHQFIAKVLSGEPCTLDTFVLAEDRKTFRPLNFEEWNCIVGFVNFWRMHNPLLIAHEQSVANLAIGYAGSLDALLILRESCGLGPKKGCDCKGSVGKLLLPDWKSSAGIWPDMFVQVAAYAKADLSKIIGDRRIQGTGIVRVGTKHKNGFEAKFRTFAQMNKDWKRFKSAIDIDDASYEPFDPSCIVDVPESINLRIDRETPLGSPLLPPGVPPPAVQVPLNEVPY